VRNRFCGFTLMMQITDYLGQRALPACMLFEFSLALLLTHGGQRDGLLPRPAVGSGLDLAHELAGLDPLLSVDRLARHSGLVLAPPLSIPMACLQAGQIGILAVVADQYWTHSWRRRAGGAGRSGFHRRHSSKGTSRTKYHIDHLHLDSWSCVPVLFHPLFDSRNRSLVQPLVQEEGLGFSSHALLLLALANCLLRLDLRLHLGPWSERRVLIRRLDQLSHSRFGAVPLVLVGSQAKVYADRR